MKTFSKVYIRSGSRLDCCSQGYQAPGTCEGPALQCQIIYFISSSRAPPLTAITNSQILLPQHSKPDDFFHTTCMQLQNMDVVTPSKAQSQNLLQINWSTPQWDFSAISHLNNQVASQPRDFFPLLELPGGKLFLHLTYILLTFLSEIRNMVYKYAYGTGCRVYFDRPTGRPLRAVLPEKQLRHSVEEIPQLHIRYSPDSSSSSQNEESKPRNRVLPLYLVSKQLYLETIGLAIQSTTFSFESYHGFRSFVGIFDGLHLVRRVSFTYDDGLPVSLQHMLSYMFHKMPNINTLFLFRLIDETEQPHISTADNCALQTLDNVKSLKRWDLIFRTNSHSKKEKEREARERRERERMERMERE